MLIDQKITTEAGTVYFKGEVTDEEFDHIIQLGLISLYLQDKISTSIIQPDGDIIAEGAKTPQ